MAAQTWISLAAVGCTVAGLLLVFAAQEIGYEKVAATVLTRAGVALAIIGLMLVVLAWFA